jgi:hypothetical protein
MTTTRPLFFLLGLFCAVAPAHGASSAKEKFRGGKVDWARLRTANQYWNRHSEFDNRILDFMRTQTTLNIEPQWNSASARTVEELSAYPFIYTQSISELSATESRNLAEYLRRGGFILIDACRNKQVNPDISAFYRVQLERLRAQFPDLRVETLTPKHDVFSIYFQMQEYPPYRKSDGRTVLHGVYVGDRMVAVISLVGFQCGWAGYGDPPNPAAYATACVQMVANIYVYAMTR